MNSACDCFGETYAITSVGQVGRVISGGVLCISNLVAIATLKTPFLVFLELPYWRRLDTIGILF